MTKTHYQKALDAARKEIADLLPQHAAIEKRVAQLRQTIATLEAITEDPDPDEDNVFVPSPVQLATRTAVAGLMVEMMGRNMALSDAVREVLKASGKPMTSIEVRDGLIRMGIDTTKYTNPLAVVHRALKRLEEKKEVKLGTSKDGRGKATYEWKTQIPDLTPVIEKMLEVGKAARKSKKS